MSGVSSPGLRSWAEQKGQSELSTTVRLSTSCGHNLASCLTFLPLCHPRHDGIAPKTVSLNKPFLKMFFWFCLSGNLSQQ